MSERNLGVFLPGHVPAEALLPILSEAPGLTPEALFAEGAPAVGHGTRQGRGFTHLSLPAFENAGFVLLGHTELPGDDDLEMYLGRTLSRRFGETLFLQYDDETGWGGHARFQDGALVSREAIDGREMDAVRRTLGGQTILEDLDPSDWVWPELGDAVERGAAGLLGPGIRTDDHLAELIASAGAAAAPAAPQPPEATRQVRPQDSGEGGRLRRLLHRLKGR